MESNDINDTVNIRTISIEEMMTWKIEVEEWI
jgi:hypothetical protein